jgi:hypothetical protein
MKKRRSGRCKVKRRRRQLSSKRHPPWKMNPGLKRNSHRRSQSKKRLR